MPPSEFLLRSPMPASAEEVFAWHARPAAFSRLQPPWENVDIRDVSGPFADGQRVSIRTQMLGPIGKTWVAEVYDVQSGRGFRDRQISGPFAEWEHSHRFEPIGDSGSILEDRIAYRLPLGLAGRLLGGGMVRDRLAGMFAYRHAVTASDLRRHALFRDRPRLTVGVTGSHGLVGSDLAYFLGAGGHSVVRFVRGTAKRDASFDGTTQRSWDPAGPVDPHLLAGLDAVVHLAGESIAEGSWTEAKKARIRESRVGPTHRLAEGIAASFAATGKPHTFLVSSGVSFYGDTGDREVDEDSPAGSGFLADVCKGWEGACEPARKAGVRVVNLRTGVVLSPKSGALAKQLPAFRAGGGAVLGGGNQWVSWISIGDTVGVLHHALMRPDVSGPVNMVSPNPVTNREFGRILAKVLRRPYLLSVPSAALRLGFGELADEALLASNRVRPGKLTQTGFAFDHPDLTFALRFVLGR